MNKMKVTAIMGSPHKGNGYKIVQQMEKELKSLGEVDFKYVFLSDIDFRMCKGCFSCISKGEKYCPLKDERENIENEILMSDGIILSSPGYAMNVSGLMKNFIDRFAYSLHRPKFFKQSLMLIANGGSGVGKTLNALSVTLGGSEKVFELAIVATPWEPVKSYSEKVEKDMRIGAKKFFASMITKQNKAPGLRNLIWFRIFKKMASLSKETLPADFEYYKDKKQYFVDAKVNPFFSWIAEFIAIIAVWSLKKKVVFR